MIVIEIFQEGKKCLNVKAVRMENRNQIQRYFLSKIHGICILLDMGGEGEEVIETGWDAFILRSRVNGNVKEN